MRLVKIIVVLIGCIVVFTIPRLKPNPIAVKSKNAVLVQATPTTQPSRSTLLLGGDVMLGRSVTVQALDKENNPRYPFEHMQSLFDSTDLVFLNLETPIVEDCPRKTDGMIFCAPPEMLAGLPLYGRSIVNIANNHTGNYGDKGLAETMVHLNRQKIALTGVGNLLTKKMGETTVGFLGFDKSQQSNPILTAEEQKLIVHSDSRVDVLIVALHWGIEYNEHPTNGQRKLAQELVDLGADVIVGHHPHWVQDVERLGKVPVYYSLGNFVFDQMWSEETKRGLLVKLSFEGKNIVEEQHIPLYVRKVGQPTISVTE